VASKRTKKKPTSYSLTDTDRRILAHTARDVTLFARHYFGVDPIPWQHYFLHAPQKTRTLIAGIRSGKTFGVALGFLHYALFHPWCRIANASISLDQAKIVFSTALQLAEKGHYAKFIKDVRTHPYPEIVLHNGAAMWFRSVGYEAELWRGQEFDWINVDEAAYITSATTIATLRGRLLGKNPMTGLHREGIFTITSSPRGRLPWLMELWRRGDPAYEEYDPSSYLSLRVRTIDNPHISRRAFEDLAAGYTERQRRQELEGEFLDPETSVFPWEAIQAMSNPERAEVAALMERIDRLSEEKGTKVIDRDRSDYARFQLPPGKGHHYLISWDLGTKATHHLGRNATVGFVLCIDRRPWEVVGYRRESQATYPMIIQWIKEWHTTYSNHGQNSVETIIDATGSGNVVREILQEEYGLDVAGLTYSQASKPDVINAGQIALERGWVVAPPIRVLLDELSAYEIVDKKIPQDTVIALCQALRRAREIVGERSDAIQNLTLPTITGRRGLEPPPRPAPPRRRRIRTGWIQR